MHEHCDVLADDLLRERYEALGKVTEDDSRIGGRIDVAQAEDHVGNGDDSGAHRLTEQLELRWRMAQHRGRRDVELPGNIRQGGGVEALRGEDPPRRFQQLLPRDPRRPAHL